MSDHVLVHGAWHGGWCWDRVARILAGRGAGVHSPTSPGLGDRADEDHGTIGAKSPTGSRRASRTSTFTEPTLLSGAGDGIPGTAIVCRPGSGLPFDEWAQAIGYEIVDLGSGHDGMVSEPEQLADLILAAS